MTTTDPIADFLTRIRNAARARHRRVDIPASRTKKALAQLLQQQKFIGNFTVLEDKKQGVIRINLKYNAGKPVITGMRRVSKPGIRQYRGSKNLPRVLGGLGVAIVSTPKGIMTDSEARKQNLGGEVLAYIW
ncbi:MAG TPA: 30S ribosomal protein S8 [Bacteroidota bacterium]|nr:30S ribosomal protein S8 [Bacteroidota bacterium]